MFCIFCHVWTWFLLFILKSLLLIHAWWSKKPRIMHILEICEPLNSKIFFEKCPENTLVKLSLMSHSITSIHKILVLSHLPTHNFPQFWYTHKGLFGWTCISWMFCTSSKPKHFLFVGYQGHFGLWQCFCNLSWYFCLMLVC